MSRGLRALPGLTVSKEEVERWEGGYRLSSRVKPVWEFSNHWLCLNLNLRVVARKTTKTWYKARKALAVLICHRKSTVLLMTILLSNGFCSHLPPLLPGWLNYSAALCLGTSADYESTLPCAGSDNRWFKEWSIF